MLEIDRPPAWLFWTPKLLLFGPAPLANDGPLAAGGISPLEPPMLGGAWPDKGVTLDVGIVFCGIPWGGIPC